MTCLLAIIYLAFISLGLPDTMLGSAWPEMHLQLAVPVSYAGIISMLIATGTVIASLTSDLLTRRLGTGRVTALSVALTAAALLGFSLAPSFWVLCLIALPYGLGAGAVDVALNNYVAIHFHARHMSWLHCFWGIGATAGPVVMALWIARDNNWPAGYLTIGVFQWVLVGVLVLTLPLWKRVEGLREETQEEVRGQDLSLLKALSLPGAKAALIGFFCYSGVETVTNLWASSYAVSGYGVSEDTAAGWSSLFFLGITLGRLASGFLTLKLSTKRLIRLGEALIALGCVILLLPLPVWKIPVALCFVGGGCAPIFPSMLHRTPKVFGEVFSQSMMGMQMACSYTGATLLPPLFGGLSGVVGMWLFPLFLLFFLVLMILGSEGVNRRRAGAED